MSAKTDHDLAHACAAFDAWRSGRRRATAEKKSMRTLLNYDELWATARGVPRLVVQCYASWNEHDDSTLYTLLERLQPRYLGSIDFVRARADDETLWPLLRSWRALNLPAFALLAFGRHISTPTELCTEYQLTSMVDALAALRE